MASSSGFDFKMERSEQCKDIRRAMHQAILHTDRIRVLRCLDAVPALRLWLDPEQDISACCRAIQEEDFYIHCLLISRNCTIQETETSCYNTLDPTERVDPCIEYLTLKSRSGNSRGGLRFGSMFKKLFSVDLIQPILKAVATAPHLEIVFDCQSENVRHITKRTSESNLGVTFSEEQRIFMMECGKEDEVLGPLAHELCHFALHLVYGNSGKPYLGFDTEREQRYKRVVDDVRKKKRLHLIIEHALHRDEEEELIVRIPHVLAQYSAGPGDWILQQEVPELYGFFKDFVVPDMQMYIHNRTSLTDFRKIETENATLRKASETAKLKLAFKEPLRLGDLGNAPLLIFTSAELRLLEVMVHNAVRSSLQPYLFFKATQWDLRLRDVLLDYKCAFVLVTVKLTMDFRDILELLASVSSVTGVKVILLVEKSGEEDLMNLVREDTFFAERHEVRSGLSIGFEHLTEKCKKVVFQKSRVKFQGQDACALPVAMNFDSFLSCVDTTFFLRMCESKYIDVGPPLHELEERVKNCYVERLCTRTAEIDLKQCELDDDNEAFSFLGSPHDRVTKLLPCGYEAKDINDLQKFEKFVVLRGSRDYEDLTEVTYYRNKVVHLLQLNEEHNGLVWTKSNGRLSHLPMTGNDEYTLEMFLKVNEKVVVVCGAPGMGKSVLASRMCSAIKKQDWKRWVLYVDLPQRMASVKDKLPSLTFLADLCQVQTDGLEFALFEESLNNGSPFEVVVIFDAFDEINARCRKCVLDLVSFLSEKKVHKLCIFTRTVFKSEVQDALHIVAYELAPFSEENQEELLTKYREERERSLTRNAAVSPQWEGLFTSLKETNKTILESPLLLRMMALMESGEIADDYSSLLKIIDTPARTRVYPIHIYKMFVEYKYLVYRREKRKENIRLYHVQQDEDDAKPAFYASHGLLAMKCVFRGDELASLLNEDELEKLKPDGTLFKDLAANRLKEGFVNGINDGVPMFVHKTFAEFFAADYLLQKAKAREIHYPLLWKIIAGPDGTEDYSGVRLLFDGLASASFPLHSAIINNDTSYFGHRVIVREDMCKVDELKRTPLHVAAMYADETVLQRLPMDDDLIRHDIFGMTPFAYVQKLPMSDSSKKLGWAFYAYMWRSIEIDRLNILCTRCSEEAVKHSDAILRTCETLTEKRRFVERAILTAVRHDLQGVLDIYLSYVSPIERTGALDRETLAKSNARKLRSPRCSSELPVIEDLDRFTGIRNRTVPFFAKSEAVCKMLIPYCDMGMIDEDGNTMLHISAERGNLETTMFHLAHSSIHVRNRNLDTPMHLCARERRAEVVKLLLPIYASVNVRNCDRETPMQAAVGGNPMSIFGSPQETVKRCQLETVKLLLLRSRMDDERHVGFTTPLCLASVRGALDIVTLLLPHTSAHTANYNDVTCLDEAARYGRLDAVSCLIPHSPVNSPKKFVSSAVKIWASCGKRKLLQHIWPYFRHSDTKHTPRISEQLLSVNGDPRGEISCLKLLLLLLNDIAADSYGETLLRHIARRKLHPTAQMNYRKLLLPHLSHRAKDVEAKGMREDDGMSDIDDSDTDDADRGIVNEDDRSVLCFKGNGGAVEAVEYHGSRSSLCITDDAVDALPLLCAKSRHVDAVKFVIPSRASVHVPNALQYTPMHTCAQYGHLDVVKDDVLLLRSAMRTASSNGDTPLHAASRSGALHVVNFILPHSFASMSNFSSQTCLHLSVQGNSVNIMKCLIQHPLVNCPDIHGDIRAICVSHVSKSRE
ncbi:uncharacterized protein LOC135386321 [Ornithodoros turicata]|uniref:uncharacterized protein LOC135386321 n=1 Tax=Ornithodoros turicata TaxID=34597 RepID=UPI0031386E31